MTADVVAIPAPDRKPFTVLVGAKVRGRMAEMGYRQADLADVLGVSQQSASKRLAGKVPFDVNELATVAGWLGVSVVQLLGDAGMVPPQGPGHVAAQSAGTGPAYGLRALGSILPRRASQRGPFLTPATLVA